MFGRLIPLRDRKYSFTLDGRLGPGGPPSMGRTTAQVHRGLDEDSIGRTERVRFNGVIFERDLQQGVRPDVDLGHPVERLRFLLLAPLVDPNYLPPAHPVVGTW